jgi:feruloyl esterase
MFAWGIQAARDFTGRWLLTNADLKILTKAAVKKCDLDDGVADQIISDPLHCNFDPAELLCSGHNQGSCLSYQQVAAAAKIYEGPVTKAGVPLNLGGPLPGSEYPDGDAKQSWGWSAVYGGTPDKPPLLFSLATDGICYLYLISCSTTNWDLGHFDFDQDVRQLREMEPIYDASNPDLRRFKDAGGKLIIVQGLSDPIVSPREVIEYYETVERTMGGQESTRKFARLFLVPGVDHDGGSGANASELLGAIDAWAEQGTPPDRLIAARILNRYRERWSAHYFQLPTDTSWIQFTRPIYPYPTRVKYKGSGSVNDAKNFLPLQ